MMFEIQNTLIFESTGPLLLKAHPSIDYKLRTQLPISSDDRCTLDLSLAEPRSDQYGPESRARCLK